MFDAFILQSMTEISGKGNAFLFDIQPWLLHAVVANVVSLMLDLVSVSHINSRGVNGTSNAIISLFIFLSTLSFQ